MLFLEWFGTIITIIGSLIMATRVAQPKYAWLLWIVSNVVFMILFFESKQMGLLSLHIIGFVINSMGFYQWKNPKMVMSKKLMHTFFYSSVITALAGAVYLSLYVIGGKPQSLEWGGSAFAIAAALILASRHSLAGVCWIMWTIGNFSIFTLSYVYTQQYGLMTLQGVFIVINTIAMYNWFGYLHRKRLKKLQLATEDIPAPQAQPPLVQPQDNKD